MKDFAMIGAAGFAATKSMSNMVSEYQRRPITKHIKEKGQRTYRSLTMEGQGIEFSERFTDLHTRSYEAILAGNGFNLIEAMPSIELVHTIRTQPPIGLKDDFHPLAESPLATYPFAL